MSDYPLQAFHFSVDWGGSKASFMEVTGLSVDVDLVEYNVGTNRNHTAIKMPGRRNYENITLKRGIFEGDNEFYDWWNSTQMNKPQRRDITISLLDETHAPIVVFRVTKAWIKKLDMADLKADSSEVAVETMEIVHEGLTIENNGS